MLPNIYRNLCVRLFLDLLKNANSLFEAATATFKRGATDDVSKRACPQRSKKPDPFAKYKNIKKSGHSLPTRLCETMPKMSRPLAWLLSTASRLEHGRNSTRLNLWPLGTIGDPNAVLPLAFACSSPDPPPLPAVYPPSVLDDWVIQRFIKNEETGKMIIGESSRAHASLAMVSVPVRRPQYKTYRIVSHQALSVFGSTRRGAGGAGLVAHGTHQRPCPVAFYAFFMILSHVLLAVLGQACCCCCCLPLPESDCCERTTLVADLVAGPLCLIWFHALSG